MDGILSLWQQPSVLLFLTLAVYALALLLRARTGYLLLNPVLISTVTLIAYLKILDIDYAVYHDAAQFIDFWLKPAVVALAVPLYQKPVAARHRLAARRQRYRHHHRHVFCQMAGRGT